MKKIFTLMAAALFAVGASAQHAWVAGADAPEKGTKLVDNDLVTVETVYGTTAKKVDKTDAATPKMSGDYDFDYYIQVRTDSPDPSADNPTGGEQGGSTPLVVTAKKNADVTFYFRRQKGSDGFNMDDNKDLLCFAQNGKSKEAVEEIVSKTSDESYGNAKKTFKFVEGGVYTIYRRGSTINLYGFDVAEGTAAGGNEGGGSTLENGTYIISWDEEPTLSNLTTDDMANTGTENNVATWKNGFSVMIMRSDKAQSSGKSITVDGKEYKTIKVSNFAQNKLILPAGKVTKKITLYSYVNKDAATDRPCFWAEVAGVTYEGEVFESYNNYTNPDKREYTFDATNEVTFTNTGEQCCYVIFVEVEDATVESAGNRRWDFTKWSDATIANLKADAAAGADTGWSDDEKNDGNTVDNKCFWAAAGMKANEDGELSANGTVIEELKGLKFMENGLASRNLAIAVDYPSTSLGDYHGGAYLWLGGKEKNYFIIPGVAAGSKIKMGVESHKPAEARGVELYVSANGERGAKLEGSAIPTVYEDQEWTVTETADIIVYNTNGCHIYYIEVTDGTGTNIQQVPVKVINNGAIYNLAGQKVDENYKGLVIKNGKKYIQK